MNRPATDPAPLYWWRSEPNFGDAMSPWLMARLLGSKVHWSDIPGKFVGLGSVLGAAAPGDVVWGTGRHPFSDRWNPDWSPAGVTFLAVRGPLTRHYIQSRGGACPEQYGDPAELLPHYHSPETLPKAAIGIVPHIHDARGKRFARRTQGAVLIDPRRPWREVVDLITACEVIWSSSLHGLIVAEAYGIPAVWTHCDEGPLKYNDYYLASERTDVQKAAWEDAAKTKPPPLPPRVPHDEHPLVRSLRKWQAS